VTVCPGGRKNASSDHLKRKREVSRPNRHDRAISKDSGWALRCWGVRGKKGRCLFFERDSALVPLRIRESACGKKGRKGSCPLSFRRKGELLVIASFPGGRGCGKKGVLPDAGGKATIAIGRRERLLPCTDPGAGGGMHSVGEKKRLERVASSRGGRRGGGLIFPVEKWPQRWRFTFALRTCGKGRGGVVIFLGSRRGGKFYLFYFLQGEPMVRSLSQHAPVQLQGRERTGGIWNATRTGP